MSNTLNRSGNHNIPTYKFPSSPFSQKWSLKQDEKLRQAVSKYGTQWTLISKKYRFDRSINSLIKRWHGKLKQSNSNYIQKLSDSENQEEKEDEIPQKSKKNRKQDKINERKNQKREEIKQQKSQQKREQKNKQRREVKQNYRRRRQGHKQNSQKQESLRNREKSMRQQRSASQEGNDEQIDSIQSGQSYVFKHNWRQHEDSLLKDCILEQKILNWEELASKLKINDLKEIRRRWQQKLYPLIVESIKIGGCVKYSQEEDTILTRGVRLGLGIPQLRRFLPGRTPYSLDARRRRTLKMQQEELPELRFWTKRLNAYKFALKRHEHLQKPAEQESFMYRSDSQ